MSNSLTLRPSSEMETAPKGRDPKYPQWSLSRLPPEDALRVNALHRLDDPVRVAKFVDRLTARRTRVIVVDDHEAARCEQRVQRPERIHGRLVEIAVESQQRELLDRRERQRVAEPALEEAHLVVEQSVAAEELLHLFEGDCQHR